MVKFIDPKNPLKLTWSLSEQTVCILEYYSRFCDYSPEYVADKFLKNLLGDPTFANYLRSQRRSKRMVAKIFNGDKQMSLIDEYTDKTMYVAATNVNKSVVGETDYDYAGDDVDSDDKENDIIADEDLEKMAETMRRTNAKAKALSKKGRPNSKGKVDI